MQPAPPARLLHVLEDKAGAGNRFIAADHSRREDCVVDLYVAQRYVLKLYEAVSFAWRERVQEAAWSSVASLFPRLVLLLGPNVDREPERPVHLEVVVKNVGYYAT